MLSGKLTRMIAYELARGFLQVHRAAVVTQAGPDPQDSLQGRALEGIDGGECAQKCLVVGEHGFNLSLLQHRFGNPDRVGIIGATPGQIALIPVVPAEDTTAD